MHKTNERQQTFQEQAYNELSKNELTADFKKTHNCRAPGKALNTQFLT